MKRNRLVLASTGLLVLMAEPLATPSLHAAAAPARSTMSAQPPMASRSTWYVDGVHGSNKSDCESRQHACKTIGHAISLSSRGDSIIVAAATYPENLTIHHSLDIAGSGFATTIVDGRGVASEIITPNPGTTVTVSGVTLRNGGGLGDGGGIYNCMASLRIIDTTIIGNTATRGMGALGYGGAIYNCPGGTLTIINSRLSGNRAEAGGAICNGGVLTIVNSTINGNMARERRGGGIFNYGTLTIDNSTFSGNSVPNGVGGGIHNGELFGQKGTLVISNSTLSQNSVGDGKGGGIFNLNGATATLQNSIVANNTGSYCSGILTSNGYNLSSDDTCTFGSAGDLNNTDPKLGPLTDNGGPTKTMALLPESPAIDAGNRNGCTGGQGRQLRTDQRGQPRPDSEDSGGCDIGAYERQTD